MTNIEIATQTFGDGGLLPRRRLRLEDKTLDTPAKALPVARTRRNETLAENSRNAAELYTQVDTGVLRQARHDPDESVLDRLEPEEVEDGEIGFPFVSYQDGHAIAPVEAQQLVDVVAVAGDILTVPLQPTLARSINTEEGLDDSAYQSYRNGVERILQTAREHPSEAPVMGVLPLLGWTYMEDLLELYAEYNVQAFCLNLDRKRITAGKQVSIMQPLARYLAARNIEEEVLLYGINFDPKDRELMSGVFPAANFAAVGLGIDIVGETHVPPRGPPEMFEAPEGEGEESTDTSEVFRLFDKESLAFHEIPISELPDHWPEDSALDIERVMERARAGAQSRSRMEALVNAEQMAIAMQELQTALEDQTVAEYLEGKEGITEKVVEAYHDVRSSFDDSRMQSGLSDFV